MDKILEHYFCNGKNTQNEWRTFLSLQKDFSSNVSKEFSKRYSPMGGYGWRTIIGYSPDGHAYCDHENGNKYYGIWFETFNRRIVIFES